MSKIIALVGHCGPDSSFLRLAVSKADRSAKVVSADDASELDAVLKNGVNLLLLNREMPYGFGMSSGVEVIKMLKPLHPKVKFMLVSNYPDAQQDAEQAGAMKGFGKREIGGPKVGEVIRAALGE